MNLWDNQIEIDFFNETLKLIKNPEKLFYRVEDTYYAYIPKTHKATNQTLQSRNSFIGKYTENWCKNLFEPIAEKFSLHAVQNVVCEKIGLTINSKADLAFCTTDDTNQKPENIKLIFEIKMSIVSNYIYKQSGEIIFAGDYKTHRGNPSLLRSDSVLKAIGKSATIRCSHIDSSKIPIIVLGNSPITENYLKKVDYLKSMGLIQGFWSLNPEPTKDKFIKKSPKEGFITLEEPQELYKLCDKLLNCELNYFSAMKTYEKLGEIIRKSSNESDNAKIAEKFLSLLREDYE